MAHILEIAKSRGWNVDRELLEEAEDRLLATMTACRKELLSSSGPQIKPSNKLGIYEFGELDNNTISCIQSRLPSGNLWPTQSSDLLGANAIPNCAVSTLTQSRIHELDQMWSSEAGLDSFLEPGLVIWASAPDQLGLLIALYGRWLRSK